jgi:hypothetical protein
MSLGHTPLDDNPPPASIQPSNARFAVDETESYVTWSKSIPVILLIASLLTIFRQWTSPSMPVLHETTGYDCTTSVTRATGSCTRRVLVMSNLEWLKLILHSLDWMRQSHIMRKSIRIFNSYPFANILPSGIDPVQSGIW